MANNNFYFQNSNKKNISYLTENYTLETPTEFPIKNRVQVLTSAVNQLIDSLHRN